MGADSIDVYIHGITGKVSRGGRRRLYADVIAYRSGLPFVVATGLHLLALGTHTKRSYSWPHWDRIVHL